MKPGTFLGRMLSAIFTLAITLDVQSNTTQPVLKMDTITGIGFDLADYRGQWVVVNFWATWCAPCLKEMPDLSSLDQAREDVAVVGLAFEEIAPDELKQFLKKHLISYPVILLDIYNPPKDFEVPRGLPVTYLIAPDGRVVEKILGPVTRDYLEQVIAQKRDPHDSRQIPD